MTIGAAQLTYNLEPAIARAGMPGGMGPKRDLSKLAAGPLKAGLGCFLVPGEGPATHPRQAPGGVWQNPTPADPGVDVDAFVTTHATVDAGVTISGTGLNGVVGATEIFPPRKVTVTLNNHANWDAATGGIVVTYVDGFTGLTVVESLDVPDAGNTTLTTAGYARSVTSVRQTDAAASGTSGSFTVGIAALDSSIVASDFAGIVMLDTATVESTYPNAGVATTDALFLDGATVTVRRVGSVWVVTEDACSEGGAVYCRIASGAGSQLGAFRSDADTAAAILIPGARYECNSGVGGLNKVYLGY